MPQRHFLPQILRYALRKAPHSMNETHSAMLKLLRNYWLEAPKLGQNPGISPSRIREFEELHQASIPVDFAAYLAEFNGFTRSDDGYRWDDTDGEGFIFHSLEQIRPVQVAPGYFIFCSWAISFDDYAISFRRDETNGKVVKVGDAGVYLVANSFVSFVDLYIESHHSIFEWGPLVPLSSGA